MHTVIYISITLVIYPTWSPSAFYICTSPPHSLELATFISSPKLVILSLLASSILTLPAEDGHRVDWGRAWGGACILGAGTDTAGGRQELGWRAAIVRPGSGGSEREGEKADVELLGRGLDQDGWEEPSSLCCFPDKSSEVKGIPRLFSPLLRSVLVLSKNILCASTFSTTQWHNTVTITMNGGMDVLCFESTNGRLSSHPAAWGRVVKVGDSDGGSKYWVH